VAAVIRRYLRQLGTFLAPRSVDAADSALRQLARWMVTEAGLAAVGDIRRDDIEDYEGMAGRPAPGRRPDDHEGDAPAADADHPPVLRADHRSGLARSPARNPVIAWETRAAAEVPRRPGRRETDGPARASADPRDRLVVELPGGAGRLAVGWARFPVPFHRSVSVTLGPLFW
jgi:hypothetical protein